MHQVAGGNMQSGGEVGFHSGKRAADRIDRMRSCGSCLHRCPVGAAVMRKVAMS